MTDLKIATKNNKEGYVKMNIKYPWWLILIGILGLISGAGTFILSAWQIYLASLIPSLISVFDIKLAILGSLLGSFLLLSAVLFLFVRSELTFRMYIIMYALFSVIYTDIWGLVYTWGFWLVLPVLIHAYYMSWSSRIALR